MRKVAEAGGRAGGYEDRDLGDVCLRESACEGSEAPVDHSLGSLPRSWTCTRSTAPRSITMRTKLSEESSSWTAFSRSGRGSPARRILTISGGSGTAAARMSVENQTIAGSYALQSAIALSDGSFAGRTLCDDSSRFELRRGRPLYLRENARNGCELRQQRSSETLAMTRRAKKDLPFDAAVRDTAEHHWRFVVQVVAVDAVEASAQLLRNFAEARLREKLLDEVGALGGRTTRRSHAESAFKRSRRQVRVVTALENRCNVVAG